jgi:hypothetical protein
MAKSHEKKVAEKSKIKQQIMYQEQKRKELEKIKQQNTLNQIKQWIIVNLNDLSSNFLNGWGIRQN